MVTLVGTETEPDIIDHLRYGIGNVDFGKDVELGGLKMILDEAIQEISILRKIVASDREDLLQQNDPTVTKILLRAHDLVFVEVDT